MSRPAAPPPANGASAVRLERAPTLSSPSGQSARGHGRERQGAAANGRARAVAKGQRVAGPVQTGGSGGGSCRRWRGRVGPGLQVRSAVLRQPLPHSAVGGGGWASLPPSQHCGARGGAGRLLAVRSLPRGRVCQVLSGQRRSSPLRPQAPRARPAAFFLFVFCSRLALCLCFLGRRCE